MTILGLPAFCNLSMEGGEMRVVASCDAGDEEEDGARPGAAAAHRPVALALAAVVGDGGEPGELGDGLVGDEADLRHLRHQHGDGAAGDALDRAQGGVEARPQRIVVDQRGDLAGQAAFLALEQHDDLIDAGERLGVAGRSPALLVGRRGRRSPGRAGKPAP